MKARVYTAWNTKKGAEGEPKCIFYGEIDFLPHKGDGIICRDGFCVETVSHVYYDLVEKNIEIGITSCDPDDEYPEVDCR